MKPSLAPWFINYILYDINYQYERLFLTLVNFLAMDSCILFLCQLFYINIRVNGLSILWYSFSLIISVYVLTVHYIIMQLCLSEQQFSQRGIVMYESDSNSRKHIIKIGIGLYYIGWCGYI